MPSSPLNAVLHQLRAAGERDGAGNTDGELLTRFLSHRDDNALAALVERHAPMVWGVCRRVLRNPHDAEDAFQATFLVLVRKAATIKSRELLANWLYGVAHQTAVRLRAMAAKRGVREMQLKDMPEPAIAEARVSELLPLLDQELSRLPEHHRVLIVLCDLEGKTRKEAARQLGCPEGTVASRLARARDLLAKRMARHGLAVSGGSLAAALAQSAASATVPAMVVSSTIHVATLLAANQAVGVISGPVAALTEGVLKAMLLKKIMATTMVVLALSVVVITGGSLVLGQTEGIGKPGAGKEAIPPSATGSKDLVDKFAKLTDLEKLQGHWVSVSCEMQGTEFKGKQIESFHFDPSFDGKSYAIQFGKIRMEGTFELDPASNPKTITMKGADGSTNLGIYAFEGEKLRICICDTRKGGRRPTEFKTKADSGHTLISFHRAMRNEVRDVVDRFLKTALVGDTEKTRALAAPSVSDQQLNRFKGLAKTLAIANVLVTPGPSPTSHGDNGGRALVVTEDIQIEEGRGKTKGRILLTLLKDDERLKTKGWLVWDIDFKSEADSTRAAKDFVDRYMPREKEAFTAWGKEVGGLQASLGFKTGEKRAYTHGETITLVVRVRNVQKNALAARQLNVKDNYIPAFFFDWPPTVTDGEGKAVTPIRVAGRGGDYNQKELNLEPWQEVEVAEVKIELRPESESGNKSLNTLYGTGKFQIHYKQLMYTSGKHAISSILDGLATGKLELEVKKPEKLPPLPPEKEALTAWGKEVGGLQAGLGFKASRSSWEFTTPKRLRSAWCAIT